MQLVEQHVIDRNDPRYTVIDAAAFASKNLYNAALYILRRAYIFEGCYLSYSTMDKLMQPHEAYKALPAKVAQKVLDQLDQAWQSFFEARAAYEEDPSTFTGRPRLPKYKHKTEGRNLLVYTEQAVSKKALKRGYIQLSMLPITVKTKQQSIDQVRIVPKKGFYVVEVIYEREPTQANVDPSFCVGIDPGVTNLAAIASNREGFVPRLVNGRPIKAWNQWYNKRMKELKKHLPKEDRDRVTRQMERITNARNRRIDHYLHMASKRIIGFLVENGIGTVIIGKNPLWKQESNMGKRNNQNFVSIPHARFIDMLTYKPNDEEEHIFSGKRIGRRNRLYRTKDGRKICADVNGAYNIVRKSRPDAFSKAKGVAPSGSSPRTACRIKQTGIQRDKTLYFLEL